MTVTRNADGQVETSAAGTDTDPGNAFAALATMLTDYDAIGRTTRERLQMGGTTFAASLYDHDAAGRLTCTIVRLNRTALDDASVAPCVDGAGSGDSGDGQDRVTTYAYDAADAPIVMRSGQGSAQAQVTQALAYGDNGEVSSVTDANGNVTAYGYDGFERPWRTSYPSAADGQPSASDYEELGYDAGSNVTSVRVRDGKAIGFAYDALGRRIQKNRPLDTPGETNVVYQYDNLGRLTEAHDSRGWSVGRVYDALGRLTEETAPAPFGSIYWRYDLAGRETSIAWPGGFHVDYDRLTTGEIAAVRENGAGAGVGVLASYGYDDLGRRTGIARGNGTATSYGYAGTPWLASLGQDLGGSTADLTRTFTRDATGAIRTAQGSNDSYVYANRVAATTSYQPDRLNRYTSAGGTTLGYDGRGNLTSATTGGTTSSYGYTADNLLATTPGGNLVYDPLDRLLLQGASGTYLRYAGDELVAEQASDDSIKRRYIHGAGPDEPLVWYEGPGAGDRRWLHADERGSVIAVSDGAGNAKTTAAYDEYGNASNPDDASLGRFRYTGQTWLADARAYYYKSRVYSSELGRFYQTDPIGYADSMNLYGYVGNDPVNFIDPTGLYCANGSPGDTEADCAGNGGHVANTPYAQPPGPDIVVTASRGGGSGGVGHGVSPGTGGVTGGRVVPAPKPQNDDIIVTARRKIAKALGNLAENYLKPPNGRQNGESYSDCVKRIAGDGNLAVGGATAAASGANIVPYPRAVPAGGSGTSIISTISRGLFSGLPRMSFRIAGTTSVGGAIGRILSRGSVFSGAAAIGLSAGKTAGAAQVCAR